MTHYRAYRTGRDGHFQSAVDLDCADDASAIELAKQLVDGLDVELWQGNRFLIAIRARPD
jgi:hypothetical protein